MSTQQVLKMWQELEIRLLLPAEAHAAKTGQSVYLTNKMVAKALDVSDHMGSMYIQAYLDAQRSPKSTTRYVLKRKGRTSRARWTVGKRMADANSLMGQTASDFARRIERALEPDIRHIATINPRLAKRLSGAVHTTALGLGQVLEGILHAAGSSGGDFE